MFLDMINHLKSSTFFINLYYLDFYNNCHILQNYIALFPNQGALVRLL